MFLKEQVPGENHAVLLVADMGVVVWVGNASSAWDA